MNQEQSREVYINLQKKKNFNKPIIRENSLNMHNKENINIKFGWEDGRRNVNMTPIKRNIDNDKKDV